MATFYQSACTVATLVSIMSCCFFLGISFSNWPYTHPLLWAALTADEKAKYGKIALDHYVHWLEVPKHIPYTMYSVISVCFLAFTLKIFKPTEDVKYFEYGSFLVYVLAVCCYVSNIRYGVFSAAAGQWGDVDEFTGLSVIAASEVIVVFLILGVVVVQSGLFYAKYEDDRVKTEFLMNELKLKLAQAEAAEAKGKTGKSTAVSTGSSKSQTKTKKVN